MSNTADTKPQNIGFKQTQIEAPESASGIVFENSSLVQDENMIQEINKAVSAFQLVFSHRCQVIRFEHLGISTIGSTTTEQGKNVVLLNRPLFCGKSASKDLRSLIQKQYENGYWTVTSTPVAHAITHELAHTVWMENGQREVEKAAKNSIFNLFEIWKNDPDKTGYGQRASLNVSEFWAEVCSRAVLGESDKYTRAVQQIATIYHL